MIPVCITYQPNENGDGFVASTLEYISDQVHARHLAFNPGGTYDADEPFIAVDQEEARRKLNDGLLFPDPLTRLLQAKDFIPEDEYREAFGCIHTNGTIEKQRRFNQIVEAGRGIKNSRQALEEMASHRWPEG